MAAVMRTTRIWVLAVGACGLLAAPASADFLGLANGDVIDTIGYTIDPGAGVFDDSADTLDIDANADDITTTTAAVLEHIGGNPGSGVGGAIDVNLDLTSETLLFLGPDGFGGHFYTYSAVFSGRAGVDDVTLFSPTGGPLPEQDGRTLITGEILGGGATVNVTFATALPFTPNFQISGTFNVTGGDSTFQSVFGSVGDLADFIGISSTVTPSVLALLADGYLFSVRDTDLSATGCGSQTVGTLCLGNVLNQGGDFTFSGNGEIIPNSPSAFVPEAGPTLLFGAGLLGLIGFVRRVGSVVERR